MRVDLSAHRGGFAMSAAFEAHPGEILAVIGPNGSGKSTLLNAIAGLVPAAGSVAVGDRVLDAPAGPGAVRGIRVPPARRRIALLGQRPLLFPHLSVRENVAFGPRAQGVPRAEARRRAERRLEEVGLGGLAARRPAELSGGQQQRVALARMLAVNPDVLLLDEPLSNLDARLRLEMRAELKRIHEEFNTTIVFVTHDQWEAMTLATQIAVMSEGELQQLGTPDEIYAKPANRFVAEFVGNPPINVIELAREESGGLALWAMQYLTARYGELHGLGSVGIRPEAIQVTPAAESVPDGAFKAHAVITGILPTGGSWIIELDVAGRKVFSVTSLSPSFAVGDESYLWVRAADLNLFDGDGVRLIPERRLAVA